MSVIGRKQCVLQCLQCQHCVTRCRRSCCRPSYCSYKSLEKTYNLEFWLQYWTVFGLLSVLEYLLFFLVRLVPMFSIFKLALVIWLQAPQTLVRHCR